MTTTTTTLTTIKHLADSRTRSVRISALRKALPTVSRSELDAALLSLHQAGKIILSRDDNNWTAKDDAADAMLVGGCPRHIAYLD